MSISGVVSTGGASRMREMRHQAAGTDRLWRVRLQIPALPPNSNSFGVFSAMEALGPVSARGGFLTVINVKASPSG